MTKKSISVILTVCLLAVAFSPSLVFAAQTTDYNQHWAADSIDYLLDENIIQGYGNDPDSVIVRPNNPISRAEFAVVINKAFGYTEAEGNNFPDVPEEAWYARDLQTAKTAGYFKGDSNGLANPTSNITRAEVCAVLYQVLGLTEADMVSNTFNDEIPAWALKPVLALVGQGLVSGYPDGSFKAGNSITRAESFVLVHKALKLYTKSEIADLSLSVSKNTILIGQDSNELYFYLDSDLTVESIPLYEQSDIVANMYDDGNFSLHGDDIAGDGIYSAKYQSTVEEDSVLQFVAKNESGMSNVVYVKYYTPLSDDVLDSMEAVDNTIKAVTSSNEYSRASLSEKKVWVADSLSELASENMIIADSISYNDNAGVYSFQYTGGICGGIKLEEFRSEFNGSMEDYSSQDADGGDSDFLKLLESEEIIQEENDLLGDREKTANQSKLTSEFSSDTMVNLLNAGGDTKSAIILNAFPAFETDQYMIEYRTDFYVNLKSEWDEKGLETSLDTDVTISDFQNLKDSDYDVICISTHGSTYDVFPAICLPEKSTEEKDKLYSAELKGKQIAKVKFDSGCEYWLLPSFFENLYGSSSLNGKFVFSESCNFRGQNSNVDESMSNAFRSAEALVGFHNSVFAGYSREFMKSYIDQLIEGKTAQNAFDYAKKVNGADHKIWYEQLGRTYDNDNPIAYPILSGSGNAALVQTGIKNGDFAETSNGNKPASWSSLGDVRVIQQLGDIKKDGNMAIITTGIGSQVTAVTDNDTEGSIMSQEFRIPNGVSELSFDYNFVSEEPREFVDLIFDDSFCVHLKKDGEVVFNKIYESINGSEWSDVEGVNFAGGDETIFQTGWKHIDLDISAYCGASITLEFIVYDVGDSVYDSACVIDNVVLK